MKICLVGERTSPPRSCGAVAKGEPAGQEVGGREAPASAVRPPPGTGGTSLPPQQPLRAALSYRRSRCPGHTVPVPALPCPAQPAAASSASRPLLAAPWTHHPRFLPRGQRPTPNPRGLWKRKRAQRVGSVIQALNPGQTCPTLVPGGTLWYGTF